MKKNSHESFMIEAIQKAREGIYKGQTPFGACIVKNGKIIATAHNVVWKTTDITAHAEVTAIREACKKLKNIDLRGCVIYSTTEPCPMCFAACHWAGIGAIYYGAEIKDAKKAGFSELTLSNVQMKRIGKAKVKIIKGLLKPECQALFDEWLTINPQGKY